MFIAYYLYLKHTQCSFLYIFIYHTTAQWLKITNFYLLVPCEISFLTCIIVLSNHCFGLLFLPICLYIFCETALHKALYCKDCITLRQPWLFYTKTKTGWHEAGKYIVLNAVTFCSNALYWIFTFVSILCYTTSLLLLKYFP